MIKKTIASAAAGVLLVGAVATTAGAASGDTEKKPKAAASGEQARSGRHRILRGALRLAAQTAAETIGVEVSELRDAVRGGQTVGELAQSKGVDPGDVVSAIAGALNARIDQAVTDGKLPEDRAAKAKERAATFAERFVNNLPKRAQAGEPAAG